METSDGASKTPQQIISEYMRSLALKSHKKVAEKYGKDFYKQIRLNNGQGWRKVKSKLKKQAKTSLS